MHPEQLAGRRLCSPIPAVLPVSHLAGSLPSAVCFCWCCIGSPVSARLCVFVGCCRGTMKRAGKVLAPLVRRAQRLAATQKRFASGGAVMNPSEADLYAGGMLTGVSSLLSLSCCAVSLLCSIKYVTARVSWQFRKAYCGPLPPSYHVDPALMKLAPTKVSSFRGCLRNSDYKTGRQAQQEAGRAGCRPCS